MAVNNTNPALAEIKGQLDRMSMCMQQQEANTSQPATKAENGNSRLPHFDGKTDPEIWLLKVESVLEGRNCPQDRWTLLIAECMRDDAELWWFQLARKEGTNKLPWDTFKERLLEQYNYLYKQANIQEKLDEIKYRNADQFIDQFNRLIIKLHKDKITEWETSYLFTRPLPASLKTQVLRDKCENLEELCHSLRRNEKMLQSGNGGYCGGALPFISFKKNPTYGNFGNKSLAQGRQNFGSQGGGHSRQASTSSQVVPMELDVVDVNQQWPK
ncbi:hypothetical protein PCANC_19613 [Puccinia coronata f. sp. avenae]|uniref:Ty3 transposon capsid-like protein domain-containing protein n=1 Tax=Puccinia coronata f. sp. avenae TaxID=200324 RepID=A0A2N5SP36_9BASI|nr:hypothetical protein PCANC_19613 [Puccinia coronata f. sp. avenae]